MANQSSAETENPVVQELIGATDIPNEIRETVVGSKTHGAKLPEDVLQLLRDSADTIKHINHQNEFTRSLVERVEAIIKIQDNPPTKET